MATIKAIESESIHRIQSGQVIVDISSVVKELVENSLDAGATWIEIRFKDNGISAIEVQDNGHGIGEADFETVAWKHYTSKLSRYTDIESLQTFGFRGEALSSLCALAKVHIITARAEDAPRAWKLEFQASGALAQRSVVAAKCGTTVTVTDIFYNLPVRRRELERNIKREYTKVLGLLQAFACISTSVKFSVANTVKGKKVIAFTTNGNSTTRENVVNIYGAKILQALLPVDMQFELRPSTPFVASASPRKDVVRITGHISKPTPWQGRAAPDRQMFFVNRRPCGLPQIAKAINQVYRAYNMTQIPFVMTNFDLDTSSYDVNVTPDKRTIFLHDQGLMIEALKASLIKLFDTRDQAYPHGQFQNQVQTPLRPISLSRFCATAPSLTSGVASSNVCIKPRYDGLKEECGGLRCEGTLHSCSVKRGSEGCGGVAPNNQSEQTKLTSEWISAQKLLSSAKNETINVDDYAERKGCVRVIEPPNLLNGPIVSGEINIEQAKNVLEHDVDPLGLTKPLPTSSPLQSYTDQREGDKSGTKVDGKKRLLDADAQMEDESTTCKRAREVLSAGVSNNSNVTGRHGRVGEDVIEDQNSKEDDGDDGREKFGDSISRRVNLKGKTMVNWTLELIVNMREICQRADEFYRRELNRKGFLGKKIAPKENEVDSTEKAEEKLSFTVSKADFEKMHIVGQFNLGFILVVRRAKEVMGRKNTREILDDDLFIVDQHAADEKYNFERLQRETKMENQPLVQARTLELTSFEEEVVINNLDIIALNGFKIDVIVDGSKPTGQRCQLLSLPTSKEVIFDIKDLEELISLLAEHAPSVPTNLNKMSITQIGNNFHRDIGIPRPGKIYRLLAMRACRSSIMIGKSLLYGQMSRIVRQMGTMDKPWNCPHGRPTMRHIITLNQIDFWHDTDGISVDTHKDGDTFTQSTGPSQHYRFWLSVFGKLFQTSLPTL